jgi:hypothetical protein
VCETLSYSFSLISVVETSLMTWLVSINAFIVIRDFLTRCHTWFLRSKPDAYHMYVQDQVVIRTVRM